MKVRADRRAGFTLLEVLIAMAITAIVATLSFASLDQAMNSVDSLRTQGQRISELNRAWSFMTRDLEHFVARPVRNEFGRLDSAMMGGQVAEGVTTSKSAYRLARSVGAETPIIDEVYRSLYEGKDPREALRDLMTRDPKPEQPL